MMMSIFPFFHILGKKDFCKLLKNSFLPFFPKFPIVIYTYGKGKGIGQGTKEVRKYTNKVYIYMYNILYISYLDSKTFFLGHVEKSGIIQPAPLCPAQDQDSHP